jgi:2-iminobutanoate/2-iminopropanoate deaminase
MSRKTYNAAGAAAVGPYSHAVEAGGMLYLSGQTPVDPSTGVLVTGDIASQTRQCFANLFAVMTAAGLTEEAVVEVRVYLTDMADFEAMNVAYIEQFSVPRPARTTIACAGLPQM